MHNLPIVIVHPNPTFAGEVQQRLEADGCKVEITVTNPNQIRIPSPFLLLLDASFQSENHEAGTPTIVLAPAGYQVESDRLPSPDAIVYLPLRERELENAVRMVLRRGFASERRLLEQKLEKSNDELQRFAYTVSHDLQEPLRTIRSYAELIDRRYKGKLDSEGDEFIHFIVDATGRMTQLLKDLLAYSQAGRPDRTRPELTASANVLQWAIMNVDRLAQETEASITYGPLPMVEADPTQLSQVFQNLLGNALKYRSTQPPAIHVSAERINDGYQFSVRDNGIGVDPEHHERIFGVFKRLHGKEMPGTGIGLAICRKIIESHGGRIWIESKLGDGVTMKFTLPAHDAPER